jgi:signal transduction histidine kinase
MIDLYDQPQHYRDKSLGWKQFDDLLESAMTWSLRLDQFLLFELGREQLTSLVLRTATGVPPEKKLVSVGGTLQQELNQEPGVWFIPDVINVADKLTPLASFVADLDGKSAFVACVKYGECVWGCLVGYSKEPHSINANEISLFSLLASNVSLLVENVQLRYGTTFRLSEALSLETVSSALVKSESLDKILALIIDEAVRLLNAQDALVLLLEDGDEWFEVIECLGSDLDTLAHRRLSVKNSLNGMVVMTGEPLISINTQTDPRADRTRALDLNVHDAIIAPLKIRERTIGTIAIHNKYDGNFCPDDINVLCSFANQAAIAINNAQLYSDLLTARNEIQQKAQELQELLVQMMNIQEKERYRIAADFHDRVVSQIVGTLYEVEGCIQLYHESKDIDGKLQLLKQMINEAIEQTRRSIYNLWPATLDHMSLIPALHEMFKQQEKLTGLPHVIQIHGIPYQLRPDVQIVIYRIVQEAMNNAFRHGAASLIDLSVRFSPQQLSIKVRDNGQGFDVKQVMKLPLACHYGLILMKERAQSIGGTLSIKSEPGKGSQVNLVFSNITTIEIEGTQGHVAYSFANC